MEYTVYPALFRYLKIYKIVSIQIIFIADSYENIQNSFNSNQIAMKMIWSGGCLPLVRGSASGLGVCLPLVWGVYPSMQWGRPPWTEFLTHASENITLPQLRCGR